MSISLRKLNIDEIKKIELDILLFIDNFCKKNNIKYFINYGTLLGAVRHKGFIPWDDDVDIMMPYSDYKKFIEYFSKIESDYKILSLDTDEKYYNNFIKITDKHTEVKDNRNYKVYKTGINIDVFPLYSFDDKNLVDKTYNLESFKLLSFSKRKNIVYGDSKIKDVIRTLFWILIIPFSPRFFAKRIEKLINKNIKENGKYYGLLASKFKYNDVFEYNIFEDLDEIEFEKNLLVGPKNYDVILKQYYGDYMKLPPLEKQVNPHELEVYKIME